MDSLNLYGSYLSILKTSKKIILLLLMSQVLMKSKARSTAFDSAMKTDEPPGKRCILQWLSDVTAQPTFESSFGPSV